MNEVSQWSLMDEELLNCAAQGMTPEQMEAQLDIPAAEAAMRVRRLLRSQDIWTEIERRQLLLISLHRHQQQFSKNIDYSDAKHVEAMTKMLDTIGKRLDAATSVTDEQLDRVTTAQAQKLLQLVILAKDRAREILAEEYPDIIIDAVDAALDQGLREAAALVDA